MPYEAIIHVQIGEVHRPSELNSEERILLTIEDAIAVALEHHFNLVCMVKIDLRHPAEQTCNQAA
ncbi:MAG TPA: hypothetical protein VFA41_12420 [Ktedonobacteraceae bacterium]|jgi:hypothetical protein|nr:hypothetical protein [Ktedonobacteraceae bacterium]